MSGVTQRLPRLLSLVPYLLARPGVAVAEAAADFGITEVQLRRDLELLWMCGLPGYGPGDLVDLSFDGDSVTVTFDAGLRRPLRLAAAEATALAVALRALAELPGLLDAGAARRALAKIESAAGEQASQAGVAVGLQAYQQRDEHAVTAGVRDALNSGRALRIHYYSASRDALSQRVVDPIRLLLLDGRGYLEAWCRQAEAIRMFRLDRVDDLDVLPEVAAPPPGISVADAPAELFRSGPGHEVAVLLLDAPVRWVADYYPVKDLVEQPGGGVQVHMRYADEAWMVRLLLGLGGQVRVLAPGRLVQAVADRAHAALAATAAHVGGAGTGQLP